MVNSKHAFWQALVFAVIIFAIGLIMGFFLETNRAEDIQLIILNSEINLLDEQVRNSEIQNLEIDCESAKESTFNFADRIFNEARKLEKYDSSSKFTETVKILHKRYDLLRIMLWAESIEVKENCDSRFNTIVYLYQYDVDDIQVKAEQAALSRILLDIKGKYSDKVLLIPIAANLELESTSLILEKYNISKLPVLIINEKTIIENMTTIEELENKLDLEDKTIRLN